MAREVKTAIKDTEHVFICGKTGTGKSTVAEMYLARETHVVKLDTKGEYYERKEEGKKVWADLEEGKDFTLVERLADIDDVETSKIIYAPVFQEQTQEHYNALMKWVYDRKYTKLWIDELMEVAPSPTKYPEYLKGLMTRGRSRRATVWSCTQRPMDIPTIVLSNSTHFFVFGLNQPQDREKIVKATGVLDFYEKPTGHKFWYFKDGQESAVMAELKFT